MPRIVDIQIRHGTAAAWTAANPVLDVGEYGVETDTGFLKYGDNVTAWNSLPYTPVLWRPTGTKTANYNANPFESVECDPSGGAFTVTLPTPALTLKGVSILVKNITSSTNAITVSPADGSSVVISTAMAAVIFECNGAIWRAVASYGIGGGGGGSVGASGHVQESDGSGGFLDGGVLGSAAFVNTSAFDAAGAAAAAQAASLPVGTTLTTTSPLTGGGSLSSPLTIAMPAATGSANGYLTSADWTTFNNKGSGTITALTGDVTASGSGSVVATIAANVVTNAKLAQMPALTIKGNNTGGTANAIDLTVAQMSTMLGLGTAAFVATSSFVASGTTLATTAPLTGGGTIASGLTLAIPQASGSVNGYLSSTDWSTFNGKVSAGRLINTTSPITGGGDLSADRTIAIPASSASVNGYLTSADWTTFNGKISSVTLTGDVTGGPGSSFATTIAANAVTNAKAAQMAAGTLKGNNTGSTANALDLTIAQIVAMLNIGGSVVADTRLSAQTTAVTVLTYTTTSTGNYQVGGWVAITAIAVDVLQFQVSWTDENSASRTATFFPQGLTSANLAATGFIPLSPMEICAKTGTVITVATILAVGGGTVTYDTGASIATMAVGGAVSSSGGYINILPQGYDSITQGTWAYGTTAGEYAAGDWYNSTFAQNDQVNYKFFLPAGTYTFFEYANTNSNRGILSLLRSYDNGATWTTWGTVDNYAASPGVNVRKTITGLVATSSAFVTLGIKVGTKNGSSSGYILVFNSMALWGTA